MAKNRKQNYKHNFRLEESENPLLNTMKEFAPENFEHSLTDIEIEAVCKVLNTLRIEYITLRWNGMPRPTYSPEKKEEIIRKKTRQLAQKEQWGEALVSATRIKLKDGYEP